MSNPLQGKGAESGDESKAGQDGRSAVGRGGGSTGGGLVASGGNASASADGDDGSGLGSRGGLGGSRAGGSAGDRGLSSRGRLGSRRRLSGRGGLLGGSGVGSRRRARAGSRARVGGAESLSGGEDLVCSELVNTQNFFSSQIDQRKHTDGNVGTALLNDTAGGSALDSVEVLADTGVVGGGALGVGLDGVVEAGQSAGWDISASLSLGQSGESNSNESGLHLVGIKVFWGWVY